MPRELGPEEAEAKRAAQIAKGRTRFAELSGAGAGAVTTGAAPIPHQKVFTSVRRDETQQSSSRSVFFLNTHVYVELDLSVPSFSRSRVLSAYIKQSQVQLCERRTQIRSR